MYVNFNENPRGNYYAGDCVVRAINIVTGISWDAIYTTLCAPSERLYVSFFRQGPAGEPCEPSVIFREIKRIIPDAPVDEPESISAASPDDDRLVCTERQCFDACAELWNTDSPRSEALKEYYLSSEKYRDRANAIGRASRRFDGQRSLRNGDALYFRAAHA